MRVGFDTNVLAYAEQVDDVRRYAIAQSIVDALAPDEGVIASQALGELYNLLTRKAGRSRREAGEALRAWQAVFQTVYADEGVFLDALELAVDHRLQFWDALIVATMWSAGCVLFLSEDLQDGFVWRSMTVANPFAPRPNPLVTAILDHR